MKLFPATEKLSCDVLAVKGYLPFGCLLKEGSVLPAESVVEATGFTYPTGLKYLAVSRYANTYFLYDGTYPYLTTNGTTFSKLSAAAASAPFLVEWRDENGRTTISLVMNTTIVSIGTEGVTYKPATLGLSCGVMRCGRLFGGDKSDGYKLKWSGEGGILDWQQGISGAGWVQLSLSRGPIIEVFNFEDELIIMRMHGITRMHAAGIPENFAVDQNDIPLSNVTEDCCVQLADRIAFCDNSGLCFYKGGKVEKWQDELAADITLPNRAATPDGKRYILAATSKALQRKVVYIFSPDEGGRIIDVPASFIAGNYDKTLCYGLGRIFVISNSSDYTFESGRITFGTQKKKVLKRLEVQLEGEGDITVTNGAISRTFTGVGSGSIRLNMRGREFKITVSGNGAVRSLKAYAEAIK